MENWTWGLSLIALTMAFHATGIAFMAFATVSIRVRMENLNRLELRHVFAIMIGLIGVAGLLLAALHGIEAALWAAAYWWLGALNSPGEAILYSVDAISTRGASGLMLEPHWRMMGALEAMDGMLLFGISTAYIFTVMQAYWALMIRPHRRPTGALEKLTGSPDARLIFRLVVSSDGSMWVHRVSGLSNESSLATGSGTWIRRDLCRCASLTLRRVAVASAVSGCSYAPTMDLLGSYFPAWMLCAVLGIFAVVIIRQVLAATGIIEYVVAPLLTYAALAVSATLLAWLFWFGH